MYEKVSRRLKIICSKSKRDIVQDIIVKHDVV